MHFFCIKFVKCQVYSGYIFSILDTFLICALHCHVLYLYYIQLYATVTSMHVYNVSMDAMAWMLVIEVHFNIEFICPTQVCPCKVLYAYGKLYILKRNKIQIFGYTHVRMCCILMNVHSVYILKMFLLPSNFRYIP